MDRTPQDAPKRTPLYDLHVAQGGRMTDFAGYELPIQYRTGLLQEHLHTRRAAGLFDVSHMGQVELRPRLGDIWQAALALERLVPADVASLAVNRQRYSVFTDPTGGILDDLMIANLGNRLLLVVNAACKAKDIAHLREHLSDACEIIEQRDQALLALQGPLAQPVLAALAPAAAAMAFMDVIETEVAGVGCIVSRSGYTGEDGYEISVPADAAQSLASTLLAAADVSLIGLGARDSLRLEAGLCLYGADLDVSTSPVEAALEWSIQKARRVGGRRPGDYPGADRIGRELASGASRRRVGLLPEGRAPVRAHALLYACEGAAEPIGSVTSGGFAPSLNAPVAMGYVAASHAALGSFLFAEVRGARLPVRVSPTPFVQKTYKR